MPASASARRGIRPHPAQALAARALAAALLLAPGPTAGQLPPQQLPELMEPRGLLALPQARPARTIAFGAHPSQAVELFLPRTRPPEGRLPVVVLLPGGCFRSDLPGRELVRAAAGALAARGWAVWAVGYRRIDEEGGGYPGTFLDVATGIDLLRAHAAEEGLDLGRVAALGHSVGGTLALWAAGRRNIRPPSPLHAADPLPLRGVVSAGGFGDLRILGPVIALSCGREVLAALLAGRGDAAASAASAPETPPAPTAPARDAGALEGAGPPAPPGPSGGESAADPPAAPTVLPAPAARGPARPDPYADTSPAALLPAGVPVVLLHGVYDHVAFPAVGLFHARTARRAGDRAEIYLAPNAGHFELIAPGHPAFAQAVAALARFLE